MNALEKLTASIRHIAKFLKSGIPTYNSKVPDTAVRKTRSIPKIKEIISKKPIILY